MTGVNKTEKVPVLMEVLFLWNRESLKENTKSPVEAHSQGTSSRRVREGSLSQGEADKEGIRGYGSPVLRSRWPCEELGSLLQTEHRGQRQERHTRPVDAGNH